jgi:hypothetical protein
LLFHSLLDLPFRDQSVKGSLVTEEKTIQNC